MAYVEININPIDSKRLQIKANDASNIFGYSEINPEKSDVCDVKLMTNGGVHVLMKYQKDFFIMPKATYLAKVTEYVASGQTMGEAIANMNPFAPIESVNGVVCENDTDLKNAILILVM